MEEEIRKILKLLEEGKINAEEAEKLIEALEDKKETKKKVSGPLNIGEIISEAITSAISVVPNIVVSGIKGIRKVNEKINWDFNDPLYIEISGGDVDIELTEEREVCVSGEGSYYFQDNLMKLTAGDFTILVPKIDVLKINLSAGDIKGKIVSNNLEIYVKMGDAFLEVESDKIQGTVSMGDLDLKIINLPSFIKLNCNMGDLKVHFPEDFDGKLIANVSMGDVSIERKADIVKGDTYVYGKGEKCYVELRCSMGDIKVY